MTSAFPTSFRAIVAFGVLCAWLSPPGQTQEPAAAPERPYLVEFIGIETTGLEDEFEGLSETVRRREEPVDSETQLRRRMVADVETFQKLLRANGYYESIVDVEVTARGDRRVARFMVSPGPLYRFDRIEIVSTDPLYAARLPEPEDVGLVLGEPARAAAVTGADVRILTALRRRGHPFPEIVNREATVDFDSDTMQVRWEVAPGPSAVFGALQITGLEIVQSIVPEMECPWESGDLFDARRLDAYRDRLYKTNLFTVVRLRPIEPVVDGVVDVAVELTERKHRSVGAGVSYYTDVGVGTEFYWEHRNLWQRGRKLRLETKLAQLEQSFLTALTVDRFRRRGQRLTASVGGGFEDTDAYESQKIGGAVVIDRELHANLRGSAGVAVRFSEVEQLDETETFQLISFPLELSWDSADDPLNPTSGFRLRGRTQPFFDFFGDTSEFLKSELTGSYYVAFDEEARWVFAHRIKIGSIVGETRSGVPADERFYAGGGGSVRGYPYQSIGPLFDDDEPIGGLSLFETSFEIRYRFAESFGVVAFVDGGSAFGSNFPDFDETLRWGAGMGLRYYSPIGPFRFDVAVPLDKDDHIDDSFQVYLSLGQAF